MSWAQPYAWALGVAICAALAVWGKKRERMIVHWVFKPTTTLVILVAALFLIPAAPHRRWVLLALILSLVGDSILMGPASWLSAGLVSFLGALLCYGIAFTVQLPPSPRQWVYLILPAAVAISILQRFWPHLGKLRWAVAAYILAMVFMAWRAFSRFDALNVGLLDWFLGCLGAVLFMTGDALLARRRFMHKPVGYGLELGVYYLAQWCLVLSFS